MKVINFCAIILLILGGLNWGLIGIFEFNLVQWLIGHPVINRIIYTAVGVSAVYVGLAWKFLCQSGRR